MKTPFNLQLNLKRVHLKPEEGPKSLHQIMWTRVGNEIEIALGFLDLNELRLAIEAAKAKFANPTDAVGTVDVEIQLYITDRYSVSAQGVSRMYDELGKLIVDLRNEGMLPSSGVTSAVEKEDKKSGSSSN